MFGDYSILNDLDSKAFRHAKIEDIPIDFVNEKWFLELQSYHPSAIAGLQNGEIRQDDLAGTMAGIGRYCFPACYEAYILCSKSSSG